MDFKKYPTPYPEINALLKELHSSAYAILGQAWLGLYLSGSLAGGDFDPLRSDIDFMILTDEILPPGSIQALEVLHASLAFRHPSWGMRLEGPYIPLQTLRRFDPATAQYPSARVGGSFGIDQQGIDGILQRHLLREQAVALSGPPLRDWIDPVPPDDLRQASAGILHEWWQPQLQDSHRLLVREYQAYAVLTMCRILFTLQFGQVVSKPRAASWAQKALGEHWIALIRRAFVWQPDDGIDDLNETLEFIQDTIKHVECGWLSHST
jgi:hypothetical protein